MPYFSEPKDCRGWWSSRTGLEQKLIILSTLLFILSFALVITVAVLKNKSGKQDVTTVAPTTAPTGSTTAVTGESTTAVDTSSVSDTSSASDTSSVSDPASSTTVPTTSEQTTVSTPVNPPSPSNDPKEKDKGKPEGPEPQGQADTRNIMPLFLSIDPIKIEKSIPSRDINDDLMKIAGA
ncbi:uncharacterized protein NPIL_235811 [Nephila pilipes]|uniref:Uncharacterized protein n=1 Tax=Nephila pilipes TaxID=299642 RepID=A0A8X6UPP5_NEPPI|nr:uncharacterized protein NPIL_235811 [Nephila pilipes]